MTTGSYDGVSLAGSLGGFRTTYRPRGGTSGDRPWLFGHTPESGGVASGAGAEAGTFGVRVRVGETRYGGLAGGGISSYRPSDGQGLVVSELA